MGGTYYALMDDAARHGEDYELLDHIPEVLLKIQHGKANPEEVSKVLNVLDGFEHRIASLVDQATPKEAVEEKPGQIEQVLKHLEDLKRAIRSAAGPSWSAART